ncbi:amino acid ABC transporter substrate-binding protein [Bombiscardovia nodaiensis]|uniref:Amino acid ABC transporter substrate-binding protein n=1 Tax=Bombiscardovia nodaiensis TaxID=2932181 RepID=A0ABM8B6L1_9BIFI|nr:amino acid ABC transporter substrate-binding protein [Bombiscardovia nodaiensis]
MALISKHNIIRLVAASLSTLTLVAGAGCGSSSSSSTDSSKSGSTDSSTISQQTVTPGTLTIATGEPAYAPYVLDNKPETGKGFEAAVAYAVGEKMGFKKDQIKWTRSTFDEAIAPGAKDYDMNIQQFSITPERKKAVDFTPSYYNSPQSIVVRADSKFASATSLKEIKAGTVGAMVGSTSYTFAKQKVKDDIKTFNDNVALAQALDSNQIDAIVVDTPVAVDITESKQVKDGKVVGQIADSDDPEGIGIVLPKGSKLTKAASQAVTDLTKDGTIKKLQETWLKEYTTDIPILK